MRNIRRKVKWSPGEAPKAHREAVQPHPYVPEMGAWNAEDLVVGSLWMVRRTANLGQVYSSPLVRPHELPFLWYSGAYYGPGQVPSGTLAIYVGTTRVEERQKSRTVSVLRKTFLIPGLGTRAMVHDATLLVPVDRANLNGQGVG